jgi:hypothetical protein
LQLWGKMTWSLTWRCTFWGSLIQFPVSTKEYLSGVGGLEHIHFLEGCQKGVGILGLFEALWYSLSQFWHGLTSLESLSGGDGGGRWRWGGFGSLFWFISFWCFFGSLFGSLSSRRGWFGLLCLLGSLCLGCWGRGGRGSGFFGIHINSEERFSDWNSLPLFDEEFGDDASCWTFDLDSDFVGLDTGNSLIEFNPISLLFGKFGNCALSDGVCDCW